MRWAILVLLSGCSSPDYLELSPFYGTGDITPRGGDAVDTDSYGAMVTVGWKLGLERKALHKTADLRFTDRRALWTDAGEPPPLPVVTQDAETGEEMSIIPDEPPKTYEEAWSILIYFTALAVGMFALFRWGVPALKSYRATRPKDGEKNTNGDSRDD